MYKINKELSICGAVYRVEADMILEFDNEPDDSLISWLKENNYPDDAYLICEYESGEYKATTNVVFYHTDDESFVDCAEHDFRVMGDVLNRPVADKYLYADINKRIKEYHLENKVIDIINDYFYKYYL